jgi:OHS family lactose permease-like MFS transporter
MRAWRRVNPILTAFSRLNGMEFGQIRMWGSLGWAVASSFSGLLFNLSPAYNFIMGSVTSVVMLVCLA